MIPILFFIVRDITCDTRFSMGNRYIRTDRPKPDRIKQAEVNNDHLLRRLILTLVFVGIAVASFAYAVWLLNNADSGWTVIEVDSTSDINLGDEFTLEYNLGQEGVSSTAEKKAIVPVYSQAMVNYYRLFSPNNIYSDVYNLCYISYNPETEIVVDEDLYYVFEMLDKYDNRSIYLAPALAYYTAVFNSTSDSEAAVYDPSKDADILEYVSEVAEFAADPDSINIELLGDNTIILHVSDEYKAFCEENEITELLDLGWLRNAFVADLTADKLKEAGLTNGYLFSDDGFTVNLSSDTDFSLNIYYSDGDNVAVSSEYPYRGPKNIVWLKNFLATKEDVGNFYMYQDGTEVSYYIKADGTSDTGSTSLYLLSDVDDSTCADMVLSAYDIFINAQSNETLDTDALSNLTSKGIYSIYVIDGEIKETK